MSVTLHPVPPPVIRRSRPFDLQGFLKRRILLVLGLGGILSASLIPVFRLVMKSHFEAGGALLVDVSKEVTLSGREREIVPNNVGDYIRTLVSRISNIELLGDALLSIPASSWPSFCEPGAPKLKNAVALLRSLTVKEEQRSFLINMTLQAEKPNGLGATLNAVMETFLTKLSAEQAEGSAQRLTYLRAERARIEERILAQRQRLLSLGSDSFSMALLQGNYSVHLTNLEQVQKLYWEAESDRAVKEGLLEKSKSDQEQMSRLSLRPYAEERVAANEGINRIEQWTYEQLQTLRSNIDGLTSKNQDRLYVEERMAAMKAYLEGHKKRVHENTMSILSEKRAYDLSAEVLKASSTYEASKAAREELARRLEEAKRAASATAEVIFNASDISYTVSQLRDRLSSLNSRIDDCEMEAKSPIKLFIDRRASDPIRPARSAGAKALLAAFFAGFGAVCGVCFGFEYFDARVRSRFHLEGALGGPSPVPLPRLEGALGSLFCRVSQTEQASQAAKALRSLAVRLERERMQHGTRVFLVAGASRGAGATSVALNLAETASSFVARVLFVDASLGTPLSAIGFQGASNDLHKALADVEGWLSSAGAGKGLCVVAPHDCAPILPARMRELLRMSRDVFDCVLVNAAPPLSDALAQFIILETDAAVVVAHEDHTLYSQLLGTLELLRAKPVSALTAVLNFSSREEIFAQTAFIQRLISKLSNIRDQCNRRLRSGLRKGWLRF
ncbi:MAG: hypothetical protein EBS01_01705 [Verrucomicrobia bacterium]|nr:hypothetical protein [Verrucomicrobiota bacterium]